jgi:hypothetical protein
VFSWLRNGRGVAGLLAGLLLWVLSAGALALSMHSNLAASLQQRTHPPGGAALVVRHLHSIAVGWSIAFSTLQLLSMLVTTLVIRACYRLRAAICFSLGAGSVMVSDLFGLLCLLIWVGTTLEVR